MDNRGVSHDRNTESGFCDCRKCVENAHLKLSKDSLFIQRLSLNVCMIPSELLKY